MSEDKLEENIEEVSLEEIDSEKADSHALSEELDPEELPPLERDLSKEEAAHILEGVLFAMGNSVSVDKMANAVGKTKDEVTEIIDEMAASWEAEGRGVRIQKLEDSYQMCTDVSVYEYLIRIAKQPKKYTLTDSLMETLSIIAYKQPITKSEIEKIRGVSSDHAVNRLVEFSLVEEIGRLDAPGRPMLFGTTEEFLRSFGVTSIEELPVLNPVQVEEFKAEAEEEVKLSLDV